MVPMPVLNGPNSVLYVYSARLQALKFEHISIYHMIVMQDKMTRKPLIFRFMKLWGSLVTRHSIATIWRSDDWYRIRRCGIFDGDVGAWYQIEEAPTYTINVFRVRDQSIGFFDDKWLEVRPISRSRLVAMRLSPFEEYFYLDALSSGMLLQ